MDYSIRHIINIICTIRLNGKILDIESIRNEIKQYISSMTTIYIKKYNKSFTDKITYCLCTALDEAILTRADLKESWIEQTLLGEYFRDSRGGEKIYDIIENIDIEPAKEKNILLEISYYLFSLGLKGKKAEDVTQKNNRHILSLYQRLDKAVSNNTLLKITLSEKINRFSIGNKYLLATLLIISFFTINFQLQKNANSLLTESYHIIHEEHS